MARVLFLIQLITALVVLPLWPGLDSRYLLWSPVFVGIVVLIPFASAAAAVGFEAAGKAVSEVWTSDTSRPTSRETAYAWSLAAESFPVAGTLGFLVALIGPLQQLQPSPLAPQILTLAFFCLVWGLLGLLLGRIVHQNALRLTRSSPLLVLTPAISSRFGLTQREAEAAQAVLDGLTYKDAGEKLSVSPATIKSHVLSVYQKTGAGNKIELLRLVEAEAARIHQTVDGASTVPGRT